MATGGSVVDPLVVEELIAARRVLADSPLAALTERELEVLAAMAEGLSNAAIAARTYSSERTVEKHISDDLHEARRSPTSPTPTAG